MLHQRAKPAKIFLGPFGTHDWEQVTALVRSAHTHSSTLPPWLISRAVADRVYAAVTKRLHPSKDDTLTCPTCWIMTGHKVLLFVDVGESLRGPMCRSCLAAFMATSATATGFPLLVFPQSCIPVLAKRSEGVVVERALEPKQILLKNLI